MKDLGIKHPEERADVRFSVLSEFHWDYKDFLERFKSRVLKRFGKNNFQKILDDFISVRIKSLRDILTILNTYDETFQQKFPKFKEVASPIKIGIVCSSAKYPFLEC